MIVVKALVVVLAVAAIFSTVYQIARIIGAERRRRRWWKEHVHHHEQNVRIRFAEPASPLAPSEASSARPAVITERLSPLARGTKAVEQPRPLREKRSEAIRSIVTPPSTTTDMEDWLARHRLTDAALSPSVVVDVASGPSPAAPDVDGFQGGGGGHGGGGAFGGGGASGEFSAPSADTTSSPSVDTTSSSSDGGFDGGGVFGGDP